MFIEEKYQDLIETLNWGLDSFNVVPLQSLSYMMQS